jgi:competence protein ComEC
LLRMDRSCGLEKMRTMPVLAVYALAGAGVGLWLPIFETASFWPLATILIMPVVWWIFGSGALIALAALTLSSLQCHWYQDLVLPDSLTQTDIAIRGVVADFPRAEDDSVAFTLRLLPDDLVSRFPETVQLRIYTADLQPQAGELWDFLVRLKRPAGPINWAGFDREAWALRNHIHANGYVRESPLNRRIDARGPGSLTLRLRDIVRQRIEKALAGHPMSPLVQGITIAATQSIDADTWQILRDSGTSHLVAISGLHVSLVAAFLWYPGRLAGGIMSSFGVLADSLLPARLLALGGAFAYGALAGYSTPTLRACLMVAAVLLIGWYGRNRASGIGILCAALLCMLLANPLSILSPGFWLSFLAVALLYTCVTQSVDSWPVDPHATAKRLILIKRFVAANMHTQFVLGVGLLLPSLIFFSQVSVISFIANLLAIPLFSFCILPLALLGSVLVTMQSGPGDWILIGAATGLEWLVASMGILAGIPGAIWQPASMDGVALLLVLTASAVSLIRPPLPGRFAGLGLLCILLSRDSSSVDELLRVQILDVGQGLAVLVQTRNHNLLYDTGARWRGGDSGKTVVLPAIQANGIDELDMLIVSHDDADHSGGVSSIMHTVDALQVLAPAADYLGIEQATDCGAGASWEWDNVEFRVVHPVNRSVWSDNNASCVLLIIAAGQKILLPGDIEAGAELKLAEDLLLREVSLVLAPHHGSRTSSSELFVNALAAKYVVFSAGYANRWGFPKTDIVQRWVDSGACALTTSVSGALEFSISEVGELTLSHAARAGWKRPWVLRKQNAAKCIKTVNSA